MNWKLILRSWQGLYWLSIVAILLQPSTPALWFGRYSNTSFSLLIGLLLLSIPAMLALRWLEKRLDTLVLPDRLLWGILIAAAFLLALIWLLPIGTTTSYHVIRLIGVYVLAGVTLWTALRLRLYAPERWVKLSIVLVGIICVLLAADYPGLLWVDEGFMASLANGIRQTGTLHLTYYEPYEKELFSLTYVGLAYWYDLFGFGFESGRLFIYAISLGTLLLVFFTARRIYSSLAAWFVLLIGLVIALNLNVYRQDVEAGFFIALGLFVYTLVDRPSRTWLHVLVGFAFGFSTDGHPNAYRFSLGIGAAYLVEAAIAYIRDKAINLRPVLWLLIGGIAGAGLYLGLWTVFSDTFRDAAEQPNFQLNFANALPVIAEYMRYRLELAPLLLLTALLGGIIACFKGDHMERMLVIIIVASTLVLGVVFGYVRTYYLIHSLPAYLLLGGYAVFVVEQTLRKSGQERSLWILMAVLIISSGGLLVAMLRGESSQSYDGARWISQDIRQYLAPDARIVGADPLYFGLHDYASFADISVAGWRANFGDLSQLEVWEQIAPTAVIVFRHYPSPYPPAIFEYLEQNQFVRHQCWVTRETGQVDLYLLDADPLAEDAPCIRPQS